MKTSSNHIIAFLLSFWISVLFALAGLKVPAINQALASHGNQNLLLYGSFIIVFCVLFFCSYGVLNRFRKKTDKQGSILGYLTMVINLIFAIWFLLVMMRDEGMIFGGVSDRYAWHKLPAWLVLFCLVCLIWLFLIYVRNAEIKKSALAPFILYAMLGVLNLYTFYTPAIFKTGESNRLHTNAYFNSIYTALHGSPYSDTVASIYGHYGILYRLPLKILGGDFIDFILLNALLLALTQVLMCLALHMMVENNILRIIGAVAMSFPTLTMRGGYYWQLWPHRVLFMSISIFFMALIVRFRKSNRWMMLLSYFISLLAILWNTESGIFCALGFAAFWILRDLCEKKWTVRKVLGTFVIHLAAVILSFMGAWGVVNAYNLLHGGTVNSIKTFLFPLLTSEYVTDLLRIELTTFPSAYMTMLLLLCIGLAWGISRMIIFVKNHSYSLVNLNRAYFVFGVSVLTLGQISYYMNRATYHNLDIGHLPSMLLMCMAAQSGWNMVKTFRVKKWKNYTTGQLYHGLLSVVNSCVIFVVFVGTVIQYGFNVDYKKIFHDRQGIVDFAAHIAANIPENTYGFGIGVPEIYAMLRWDTQIYTSDFPDASVYPPMTDYIIDDMKERRPEGVLVGEGTLRRMVKFSSDQNAWFEENYTLDQTFEFEGAVLEYYVLNE
ncbi:MAG: hypothetical protein Q4B47_00665 [Eubacteriales bacterium]|nr:hypothetical protein [Eubacteriales bacterium]